ncbi:MAG: DUF4412 domain-containing protein [Chitinophagaceae bacterium]
MQHTKRIFSITLSALLLLACSGNTTSNESTGSSGVSSSSSFGSGKDTYYEYTITSGSKELTMNGVMRLYISSKGDMRMEQNLTQITGGKTNSVVMVVIGHADKPEQTFTIDDAAKTYTINNIDSNDMNTDLKVKSNAVKIDEEKIMGFNCVHARVTSDQGMGSIALPAETFDLWRSNDVPVQSAVQKLMNRFESRSGSGMYSPATAAQLKQMGCDGFMVKMAMKDTNTSMTMQLTKVEHKDIPASMFELPAGYKESKE